MSENWQVGDLALCTYQGEWFALLDGEIWPYSGPVSGQVLTVRCVARGASGSTCLLFADFPDPDLPFEAAYVARLFRKMTPPAADKFDREIIAALAGQPEQVPA